MFDDSCYMEPLHLAGRLIMENGGETCRVEETVLRMGHAFGFREVECFAVPSGLFVSYRKSDGTIETAVKRIRRKGIDLTRIDEVNAISRHLEQEKMSCQEVLSQLKAVERRPSRLSPLQMAGAAAMSTAGWSLMFGGGADSLSAYSACFAPYVSEYAGDVAPEYDLGGGIWTPFSALPVVLIYNTKLVRQNPPERWADLLDAGWRGRIAFADPTVSGSSCTALGTLLQAVGGNTDNTLSAFFRNLDGRIIADSGGVVPAVADGSCYVGVTLEENARKAIADGLDVAIVYPAEGTSVLPDGAAIVRGCAHEENARKFIDFLLSPDVQQLLGTELSRRSVRTDTASDALPDLTVLPYDLRRADERRQELFDAWQALCGEVDA